MFFIVIEFVFINPQVIGNLAGSLRDLVGNITTIKPNKPSS